MKIFLSSTYIDLVEYRKAAHNALERLGQEVGRMEIFGARNEEAKTVALDQLEKSDLVVGIYAHRYGFIPESSDISITEQEYVYAKNKDKPVLCFVVDEDLVWPPKMIEKDAEKIKKLEDFKVKILKEKVVDFFTTPSDLAMRIATSVHNFLEENKPLIKASSPKIEIGDRSDVKRSSTLPSQPFFFGRDKELSDISIALNPNIRTWGALIYGPGGIGKTELAIRAAYLADPALFEQKIFITAKIRELTPEGEIQRDEFSRDNYLSILNELALELGEDGIPRRAPDERPDTLRLALKGKKALIIIDNLESLSNDDRSRIFQFLRRLPEGNKAIVTSRRRDDADAHIIPLEQLLLGEADKLISELVNRNPRLYKISENESKELFFSTNGNPLLIRWIIGQVGRKGSNIKTVEDAITFMRHAPRENDPLEYVFGDLLLSLTPTEKIVLAAMTHLSESPKPEWIGKITDLSESTVETVWDELVNRSMLVANKKKEMIFLPTLTNQFIQKKLPKEVKETEEKLARYALRTVLEFGARENRLGIINLEEKWPAISASLPYFVRHHHNDLQILCDTLDIFFKFTGRWDEWLWLNQQAELVALANEDYDNAGERAYKVGLIYSYLEKPNEILQYATRAEKHWGIIRTARIDIKGKTLVNHLRGISYKMSGNYEKAIDIITNALDSWKKTNPEGIEVAAVLNTLGEIQIKDGEMANNNEKFVDAERNFTEAIRLAKINNHKEGLANYIGNLADIAIKNHDWQKVESLASDALRFAEELGLQDAIAKENLHLAIAYMNLRHGGHRGLVASRKAVEIYKRLRHKDLPGAEAILREWES